MALPDVLENDISIVALAPGASVVVAHGLHEGTAAVLPDDVYPDRASAIRVSAKTTTTCTFINDGVQPETAVFRAWRIHTIERVPGASYQTARAWQGLGNSAAGGNAPNTWKTAVRLATDAALAANTPTAQTITADANGALTIDGVLTVTGNRVLIKNETGADEPNNGIYDVTDAGTAGTPWILTRSADANSAAELLPNTAVFASEGAINADTAWEMLTNAPIVIGTTPLVWIKFVNPTLQMAYSAGIAGPQTITIDSTRLGIQVRDLTPVTNALIFGVGNNAGTPYVAISADAVLFTPRTAIASSLAATGFFRVTRPTITAQTTASFPEVVYDLSSTITFIAGAAIALGRGFVITPPAYDAAAARVITEANTFNVEGPPVAASGNMTFTRVYSLRVGSGISRLDEMVMIGGIPTLAPTATLFPALGVVGATAVQARITAQLTGTTDPMLMGHVIGNIGTISYNSDFNTDRLFNVAVNGYQIWFNSNTGAVVPDPAATSINFLFNVAGAGALGLASLAQFLGLNPAAGETCFAIRCDSAGAIRLQRVFLSPAVANGVDFIAPAAAGTYRALYVQAT